MTSEIIVCFFAVACAVISMLLKNISPQFSMLLTLSATILFLIFFFQYITPVIEYINSIISVTGYTEYFAILIKALGICLIVSAVAEICRDLGENSIADKALMCGKASLIYLSLPVIKELFKYIGEFSKNQ